MSEILTPSLGNPSGRLLELMQRAVALPGNQMACDAWAKVFECDTADTRAIVDGMARLFALVESTRNAINMHVPGDKVLFLKPLDNVEQMLYRYPLNIAWSSCIGQLDASTMMGLAFGKHALDNSYPTASQEVRDRIIAFVSRLDSLLIECINSDLSDDLKKTFRKHLEAIRVALLDYLAGGAVDLDAITDSALGAAVKHNQEINDASENDQSVIRKILSSFSSVNHVLGKTQEMMTLAGPIVEKFLPFIS